MVMMILTLGLVLRIWKKCFSFSDFYFAFLRIILHVYPFWLKFCLEPSSCQCLSSEYCFLFFYLFIFTLERRLQLHSSGSGTSLIQAL